MTFAKQIRKWRGKRSRKCAAADLDIPYSTYRSYENGKRAPGKLSRETLISRMSVPEEGEL